MDVETRFDEFTAEEIVIARNRGHMVARTPGALPPLGSNGCPFCKGHESETEQTLLALPSEADWQVRVVGNKFPLTAHHEVVIENPLHDADLADFTEEHLRLLLSAVQQRVLHHELVASTAFVSVFRNRGRKAGSSQPHPHLQIAALPAVPPEVRRRALLAEAFYVREKKNLLAAAIAREEAEQVRVVESSEKFLVFVPYAPHRRFETWIAPRFLTPFASMRDALRDELADLVSRTSKRLRKATESADMNVLLRQMPTSANKLPWAFWYVEFAPRLGAGGAGFEISTGLDVLTKSPEDAARELREVSL